MLVGYQIVQSLDYITVNPCCLSCATQHNLLQAWTHQEIERAEADADKLRCAWGESLLTVAELDRRLALRDASFDRSTELETPYSILYYDFDTSQWTAIAECYTDQMGRIVAGALYSAGYKIVMLVRYGLILRGWPSKEAAINFEMEHHCEMLQNREKKPL